MKLCTCSLRKKLFCAGIILPVIIVISLFIISNQVSKKSVVKNSLERARAICMSASFISQDVQNKWQEGIYSEDMLIHWLNMGEVDKIFSVAPVIGASRFLIEESKNQGYSFRVAGFEYYGDRGNADAVTQEALAYMTQHNQDEYYQIDKANNQLRYYKSIKTASMCLNCHGDSEFSKMLWKHTRASADKAAAVRLDKWKEGERHGAYEVVLRLDKPDPANDFIEAVVALF